MRSAIFYPERQVTDPVFLRNALLLWDELHVIDTNPERPHKDVPEDVHRAWKILGKSIQPTHEEKDQAHHLIQEMLKAPEFLKMIPQDAGRTRALDSVYEIYPDKFLECTWSMLRDQANFERLHNGDYGTSEAIAITIMSKLAEACAGNVFARVTNRIGGYALAAEAGSVEPSERVVPVALGLFDLSKVDLATVVEFREKEKKDPTYRDLRHRYLADVERHISEMRSAKTIRQVEKLHDEYSDDLHKHLRDLKDGMKTGRIGLAFQAVVSVVVGVGTALFNPAAAAGNAVGTIRMVGELFKHGLSYGNDQRALMSNNPLAYMYMLDRRTQRSVPQRAGWR